MDFLSSVLLGALPQGLFFQQNKGLFIFDTQNLGFCVFNIGNMDFLSFVLLGALPQGLFFQQKQALYILQIENLCFCVLDTYKLSSWG